MEEALRIAALVALSAFTILSIIAMFTIRSVTLFVKDAREGLKDVSKDIKEFKTRSVQSLDEFAAIKVKAHEAFDELITLEKKLVLVVDEFDEVKKTAMSMMKSAEASFNDFETAMTTIEDQAHKVSLVVEPFNKLSEYVYARVAPPIIETANIISATSKAITVFAGVLSRKKKDK
jgi:uncharacterized protein YoxC